MQTELQPLILAMEDALNEPPRTWDIEPTEVRDFRHSIYHGAWTKLRTALMAKPAEATPITDDVVERVALIERLREQARRESDAHRMMAEAKSLRQGDCDPPRKDLYMWVKPEQTDSWKAADALAAISAFAVPEEEPCDICHGYGETFGHAPDCDSDSCALAGGIDDCLGQVDPCPKCAPPSTVPEGWQLVPVEPTEAMLRDGDDASWEEKRSDEPWKDMRAAWFAMLSAAPKGGE